MLVQLAACLLAAPVPQAAPPTFRVVLLETAPGAYASPSSINSKGEISGALHRQVLPQLFRSTAAYWDPDGALIELAQVLSSASAINDSGVMVGSVSLGTIFDPRWYPVSWTLTEGVGRIP